MRQIQRDLSKCSITEELFSEYTSWYVQYHLSPRTIRFPQIDRYPELRELELRQLARVLLSSDSGPTLGLLKAKIKAYAHGELPHAENILPALYELMESDESVKETPILAAALPDQQATGGDWEGLKNALTNSLRSGTFLDSQFYAVESRSSTGLPKIRPLYFCSTVGGSFASELVACKSPSGYAWVVADSSLQVPQNSEHGEHHLLDAQMGVAAISTMRILTQRAPRSVILVQSCSLIRSKFIAMNSV